ncbi:MarR family winged helix-turn-helix transcriptional regulator [Paractinoplanes globisporus]|uniref:MarR family winged helix-turn-helix transcriptional regulator n=1 Tax=Paractinoplanes globisporus TaxID=113565 RepID=A0ABW6WM32_9ACTN|nr:MarR family winged helix-turn-helix transcriptional regulator [Actinoplanes globisporus]
MTGDPPYAALEREFAIFVRRARAASERLSREVHPELDSAAYGLLALLWDGPQRPSDVADQVGVGKATITRQLKSLESLSLIERLPDAADGRAHLVALTEKGRSRMASVRDARRERMRRNLDAWPDEDVRTLTALLARFNAIPRG